ncbi:Chromosome partition protein Smc [Roseimaritima multifibrata]|uniref:Chromosome partition protein Smc n=1 Tax=Roseimaritima multifibrata TaxID=1930274 RepID=A0A517M9W1_9BACT|nr:c-type cytochrome domain-containing protein [Roseimaritima multifibrata]QDS91577.1 Chromosome partition protein Smc [Roseimaritima multifibrata]
MSVPLSCSCVRAREVFATGILWLLGGGKATTVWMVLVCSVTIAAGAEPVLTIAELERTTPVDFATEIAPILKRSCVACHHKGEAEGGLVLESHASLMKGGDSGPAVIAKDAKASLLLMRATGEEEPLMPPEDNDVGASPLTAEELGLWQLWIQQGAVGSGASETEVIKWQPIPESLRAVYALDVSPDGQQFAFARGNRLFVAGINTPTKHVLLADSELGDAGVADVDLIQSIAFSPDGLRLASGGFRTLRLWKRTHAPLSPKDVSWLKPAQLVAAHPDGSAVALVNAIGDVEVWDVAANDRRSVILGHSDPVIGMAWAGSTGNLVVADNAGRVTFHDAKDGRELATIKLNASLAELTTSSDGVHAAVRTDSGAVQLLRFVAAVDDAPAGIEVAQPSVGDLSDATAIALIAKPSLAVAVATESRGVLLVDAATNKVTRTLEVGSVVDALAVSADQTQLVTGGRDAAVVVWNLDDGKQLAANGSGVDDTLALGKATRDANRQKALVAKLTSKTKELQELLKKEDEALAVIVKIRDAATVANDANEEKRSAAAKLVTATEATIAKTTGEVTGAEKALAQARAKLEKASKDLESQQAAINKDAEGKAEKQAEKEEATAAEPTEAAKQIAETQAAVAQAKADIAAGEKAIASGKALLEKATKELETQRATLKKMEAEKAKSEAELVKQQRLTDAASVAQKRATDAIPEHQRVVDAETRRLARLDAKLALVNTDLKRPGRAVIGIAISPDATRIATVHQDGSSRVLRSSDGQPLSQIPPSNTLDASGAGGNARFNIALVGDKICRLAGTGTVQCWPLQEQWVLERTIGATNDREQIVDRVTAIDFRPDAMTVAVGSGEPSRSGTVKIFDVQTGQLVRDLGDLHTDSILGLAFSPDGRTLASSSADRTIGLTDVASGQTTRRLEGHSHHVLSVAWQDSGSVIASAGADQAVKIWNAETGETSRTVSGFAKEMTAIRFVEATDQLVAASGSGEVRLVNSTNGAKVRSYDASKDFLFAIAVTPDGKQLIAGGESGVVRIWNVADGKLIAESK